MPALVSVVMPYYELPEYLPQAVRSVLSQSHPNVELIVVDDGSRRAPAVEVLASAGLPVSLVLTLPENRGLPAARNAGVRAAKGDFIVTLDGDDFIQADFIAETLKATEAEPQCGGAYTEIRYFGDRHAVLVPEITLIGLLSRQASTSALLFRREVFEAVGGFREQMPHEQDTQFFIDAIVAGYSFHRVDRPLYWYRQHERGLSRRDAKESMRALIGANRELYREHFDEVILALENKHLELLQEYWQIPELNRVLECSQASAGVLLRQLNLVRRSHSWQLTGGLRQTRHLLKSALNKGRRLFARAPHGAPAGNAELIAASGLFDEGFYLHQCRQKGLSVDSGLHHFVQSGWQLDIDPNEFFDCSYYQAQISAHSMKFSGNPLVHYITTGAQLGLPTSPLFDTKWYVDTYPDVGESGMNPLAHFLKYGLLEDRLPSRSLLPRRRFGSARIMDGRRGMVPATGSSTMLKRHGDSDRPYDIVLAVHEASRTGAPMLALSLAKQLTKRGYHLLIVLQDDGELIEDFFALADVLNLAAAEDLRYAAQFELNALMASGSLVPGTVAIMNSADLHRLHDVFKRSDCKIVSLIHEFLSSYPLAARENILANSQLCIYSSRMTQDDAWRACGIPCPSELLPQGLIDDQFGAMNADAGKRFLESEYGIPRDAFVVLGCGTVDQRKGVDTFTHVARAVLKDVPQHVNAHFVWVGGEHHSIAHVLRWAESDVDLGGLKGLVHFVGHQSEIEPFFAGADVFLLPSRQDPLPCVLHLAQAARLPVIAFDQSGGASEVLREGGGRLVAHGSVLGMVDAVLTYYHDGERRRADGVAGAAIVAKTYKMREYVDRVLELSCLPASKSPRELHADVDGAGQAVSQMAKRVGR